MPYYIGYAAAVCLHLLVAEFQKKPISSRAVPDVVVESATHPEASNEAPSVNGAVAVPVIEIRRVSPSTGVPVIVKPVMVAVCPVILHTLKLSVLMAGVAEFTERAVTLLVTRLLVSVCVLARSTILAVSLRPVEGIAILADQLKDTPAMVRAVCNIVALPALPEIVV